MLDAEPTIKGHTPWVPGDQSLKDPLDCCVLPSFPKFSKPCCRLPNSLGPVPMGLTT